MPEITFTVPGKITGKQSHLPKKGGSGYKNPVTASAEAKVGWLGKQAGLIPREGPIELIIVYYYLVPNSYSKKKMAELTIRFRGKWIVRKITKPDTDNMLKTIKDGLEGVAYHNDAQVWRDTQSKIYGDCNETVITVRWENA